MGRGDSGSLWGWGGGGSLWVEQVLSYGVTAVGCVVITKFLYKLRKATV